MKKTIMLEDDVIHLKRDFTGWRIIHPMKNLDGSINWKNLLIGGSWIKFWIFIFFIFIIFGLINEYTETIRIASECLEKVNMTVIKYYGD